MNALKAGVGCKCREGTDRKEGYSQSRVRFKETKTLRPERHGEITV